MSENNEFVYRDDVKKAVSVSSSIAKNQSEQALQPTPHTQQTGGETSSTDASLAFPQIDQDQARRQLAYLEYETGNDVYLRFFYPSLDPQENDSGRKADRLN